MHCLLGTVIAALSCSVATTSAALAVKADYDSPLAQYALQKVLNDASEMFGYPLASSNRSSRANWMAAYPDSTPLTSLNIPGIHDADTWNYSLATQEALLPITDLFNATLYDPKYYRCQRASIAAALDAGVRFFDLRYALDPTDTKLVFWHDSALQSETAGVEELLFAFWNWLDAHPTEVLLLSFQYEGSTKPDGANDAQVQLLLFDALTSPSSRRYFVPDVNSVGSLGDARGRAILVRRFDLDQLPASYNAALPGLHLSPSLWTDDGADIAIVYNTTTNATAYVEDYYEPDDVATTANASVNIAAKVDAVLAHLDKAAASSPFGYGNSTGSSSGGDPAPLFITFASAEHVASTPPVWPEIMAIGNGSALTPLGGVNQQLLAKLPSYKGKRLGIVVLDFWDEPAGLIDAILDL
ncbi:PLC-like phosphodiesterase [Xylariales sp. PMI_506]|nr:PLC-like phosphodiesterase [Xylariales sp. PMI_506]